MKKINQFITNHSVVVVIIALLLFIPSLIGYVNTKINYNILVYLPEDIETMKGQKILEQDFHMGSFAMCTVSHMENKDLINIYGGAISINSTLINAAARLGTLILELGRSLGSAIYRSVFRKYC